MKNILKIIVLTAFFSGILITTASAQDYKTAIGLRLTSWGAVGASLKRFTNEHTALEANVNFKSYSYFTYYTYNYIDITGLYEKYDDISDVKGLKYYYGGGPVVGIYSYSSAYSGTDATFRLGVAGVLGLDYKFSNVPIDISIDYMPSFNFLGGSYFNGNRGGLAVRYTF